MIIHKGNVKASSLVVTEETKDEFQLWHSLPFCNASELGIELLFSGEDTEVTKENTPLPFIRLSEKYYKLEIPEIETLSGYSLLVLPYHRYYSDPQIPVAIISLWDTDWWKFPIQMIFQYQESSIFKKNLPFVQVIPILREKVNFRDMTDEEYTKRQEMKKGLDKYTTRKWTTKYGSDLDNLYNVLSEEREMNWVSVRKRKGNAKLRGYDLGESPNIQVIVVRDDPLPKPKIKNKLFKVRKDDITS